MNLVSFDSSINHWGLLTKDYHESHIIDNYSKECKNYNKKIKVRKLDPPQ